MYKELKKKMQALNREKSCIKHVSSHHVGLYVTKCDNNDLEILQFQIDIAKIANLI